MLKAFCMIPKSSQSSEFKYYTRQRNTNSHIECKGGSDDGSISRHGVKSMSNLLWQENVSIQNELKMSMNVGFSRFRNVVVHQNMWFETLFGVACVWFNFIITVGII